jgi:hypothetical protein
MAFEIPDHFNRQFTTNTDLLLQQRQPVMLQGVETRAYQGEAAQVVKQFGSVDFAEKASRHGDTIFSDIAHKQRWIFPTDYTLTLPVDKEDELRMLDSPLSPYAEAMRAGWARKINDVVRDALLGTSQTGKNGATATAFDTANQQIAAGSVGLTISKLRTAREKLLAAHVDPSEAMFFAVTAKQMTNLLQTTEITSADYNTVKALVSGQVDTFLGFKFIHNERLGVDGSSNRRCIAWAKSGIVFGQWNGLETKIGERPDKEYLNQVFMRGTIGGTRTQEAKVVEVLCTES